MRTEERREEVGRGGRGRRREGTGRGRKEEEGGGGGRRRRDEVGGGGRREEVGGEGRRRQEEEGGFGRRWEEAGGRSASSAALSACNEAMASPNDSKHDGKHYVDTCDI